MNTIRYRVSAAQLQKFSLTHLHGANHSPLVEYDFLHEVIPSPCLKGRTTGGDEAEDVAMSQWACQRPAVAPQSR